MPGRGGCRQGAGRKAAWEHGKTETIRVPVALKSTILDIGRELDQGEEIFSSSTCMELQRLVQEWEDKCQNNDAAEWQYVQQLLAEIKDILSRRKMRHRRRARCASQTVDTM